MHLLCCLGLVPGSLRDVRGPGSRGQRYLSQPEIVWLWLLTMGGGFRDQGVELKQSLGLGEIAWAP